MAQIVVSRIVKGKDSEGKEYDFVIPDMMRMMCTHVNVGDELLIPVNTRNDQITVWETGGRNNAKVTSVGTIICNNDDSLLDAILFSKLNRIPNGKQALIALKPGYRMYAGKISIQKNFFVPRMKVIRLSFIGIIDEPIIANDTLDRDVIRHGRFVVEHLYTNFEGIKGCIPAERLIQKLYTKNVIRPYYVNGWSISNTIAVHDKNLLKTGAIRIRDLETKEELIDIPNDHIDKVEDEIVRMKNQKLSAVFQYFDFESGIMSMTPLKKMLLSDIVNTLDKANAQVTYSIPINNAIKCYNRNIMLESDQPSDLEMAMMYDDKHAIRVGERQYALFRGFRG